MKRTLLTSELDYWMEASVRPWAGGHAPRKCGRGSRVKHNQSAERISVPTRECKDKPNPIKLYHVARGEWITAARAETPAQEAAILQLLAEEAIKEARARAVQAVKADEADILHAAFLQAQDPREN